MKRLVIAVALAAMTLCAPAWAQTEEGKIISVRFCRHADFAIKLAELLAKTEMEEAEVLFQVYEAFGYCGKIELPKKNLEIPNKPAPFYKAGQSWDVEVRAAIVTGKYATEMGIIQEIYVIKLLPPGESI